MYTFKISHTLGEIIYKTHTRQNIKNQTHIKPIKRQTAQEKKQRKSKVHNIRKDNFLVISNLKSQLHIHQRGKNFKANSINGADDGGQYITLY